MDSASAGRPLWGALAALAVSDCTNTEFLKLLIYLGDGISAYAQSIGWGEEEDI